LLFGGASTVALFFAADPFPILAEPAVAAGEPSKGEEDIELPAESRYAAYLARLRSLAAPLIRHSRYVAYSSDVGESLRPVISPALVHATYAIAIAYCAADVANEGENSIIEGVVTDAFPAAEGGLTFECAAAEN
jgi:hypothetical protein